MNALLLAALTVHFASAKEVKPAGHATVSGVVELPLYKIGRAHV